MCPVRDDSPYAPIGASGDTLRPRVALPPEARRAAEGVSAVRYGNTMSSHILTDLARDLSTNLYTKGVPARVILYRPTAPRPLSERARSRRFSLSCDALVCRRARWLPS